MQVASIWHILSRSRMCQLPVALMVKTVQLNVELMVERVHLEQFRAENVRGSSDCHRLDPAILSGRDCMMQFSPKGDTSSLLR